MIEKDCFKSKTWLIPLPDFQFEHQPYNKSNDHRDFLGRDKYVQDFIEVLRTTRDSSGSYLVTGYRGAGKTSFVKRVLKILSDGSPDLASYSQFLDKYLNHFKIYLIKLLPKTLLDHLLAHKTKTFRIGIFALVYLLFAPNGWWDFIVFPLLLFLYYFQNYGYAIGSPKQWRQWIFRPVVQVHVNLGHDIHDPKTVIFGIITSLRDRYKESLINKRFLARFILQLIILLLSIITVVAVYRLFPEFHNYMEMKMNAIIIPSSTDSKKTSPSSTDSDESLLLKILNDQCKGKVIVSEETMFPVKVKKDWYLGADSGQDQKEQKKQTIFSSEETTFPHKVEKNWHVDTNSAQKYKEQDKGKPIVSERTSSEQVPLLYAFREFVLVPPYCGLYHLSQDLYFFTYESNKLIEIYFVDNRLAFLFRWLDKIVNFFDWHHEGRKSKVTLIKNDQEMSDKEIKDLAPRPYHILLFFLVLFFLNRILKLEPTKLVLHHLDETYRRIEASDILDAGVTTAKFPFLWGKHMHYHRIDARQAENLLLQILDDNANKGWLIHPHIIFIFDELDKIHPPQDESNVEKLQPLELGLPDAVRQRKYEVEKLLGSLKNLITVAPCHFIFVAGREMMDAHLADRGEIRFLYGSLFDRVFYVPSLLTDDSDDNKDDISSMVEQYVCRRLMSPTMALSSYAKLNEKIEVFNEYKCWSLRTYMQYLKDLGFDDYYEDNKTRFRLVNFLQDFIYFLSYRSGGNTKKLDLLFEEFVYPLPKEITLSKLDLLLEKFKKCIHPLKDTPLADKYYLPPRRQRLKGKLVLWFNQQDQYRVQLIGHFFTMFHGTYSKLVSNYGDKLSVSVFSILDYVCKFHSMGFARRDLERMPEVLDIHRAPAVHQIIDLIINKILLPHTRKINNGFYNFRFVPYIQQEILYISQFSEQDMAAFNFSLDESIQIKQHYQQMLNEQIKLYTSPKKLVVKPIDEKSRKLNILYYLHTILGDLHGQDNEFDQTIVEYNHALSYASLLIEKCLKECQGDKVQPIILCGETQCHFNQELGKPLIDYVHVMLKLGLLQERRLSYDSAIAIYHQAAEVVTNLLQKPNGKCFFGVNVDQLESLLQPYFCLAFLHAKRDSSSKTANLIMERSLDFIETRLQPILFKYSSDTQSVSVTQRAGLTYKNYIRWAELWMMRSQFEKAIDKYWLAMKNLCKYQPFEQSQQDEIPATYGDLGIILTGLADACTALALYCCYQNENKDKNNESKKEYCHMDGNDFGKNFPNSNKYNTNRIELEKYLKKAVNLLIKKYDKHQFDFPRIPSGNLSYKSLNNLLKKSLCFYVLASYAYRLADLSSNEMLVLLKLAYAVTVGLSYIDVVSGNELENKENFSWIFEKFNKRKSENPIRSISSQVFGGAYSVYKTRLRDIGIKDEELLKWVSPPLNQALIVFGYFWNAYWENCDEQGNPYRMNEKAFEIIDMGVFPMNARIIALYLKGRWYQKFALGDKEREYKAIAFRLLVQALIDGQAFEGDTDLIAPPLGMIHYHVWELAKENHESDDKFLKSVRKLDEFKGEMQRHFDPMHCANRTKTLLMDLLSRHNIKGVAKDKYFMFMNKRYYLYDAFSDSYAQSAWIVEYGLVPVAEFMLRKINESYDDLYF